MRKIYFENPAFRTGENLTCRRGIKWALSAEATGDFDLELKELDTDNTVGFGNITKQLTIRFKDLTDADLALEHDKECRTVDGLRRVMKEIYDGFDDREVITLVFFTVEQTEI